jgi:hypothetical protein
MFPNRFFVNLVQSSVAYVSYFPVPVHLASLSTLMMEPVIHSVTSVEFF